MAITVTLRDVVANKSIDGAIAAILDNSDFYEHGVIGEIVEGTFDGALTQAALNEYADRALQGEVRYYVDLQTGRVASKLHDGTVMWTAKSQIALICPNLGEAIYRPKEVAEMACAALEVHSHQSYVSNWAQLIQGVRKFHYATDDIDIARLLPEEVADNA